MKPLFIANQFTYSLRNMPIPARFKPKFIDSFFQWLNDDNPTAVYQKIAVIVLLTMLAGFINSFNSTNF